MQYPKPKDVALSLLSLFVATMSTGKRRPIVRLTHEEFRRMAGRPGAMRTQVLRSIESHLAQQGLHLFRSKDLYLLVELHEPKTWRAPTARAIARFATK